MKQMVSFCLSIAICSATWVQPVYANEGGWENTIYVTDPQEIIEEIQNESGTISQSLNSFSVQIDENTIMPVFQAALSDFVQTGVLGISGLEMEKTALYVADVNDAAGKFAGIVEFTLSDAGSDVQMIMPTTDKNQSIAIYANRNRMNALLSQESFSLDDAQAKLLWVEGLGYVYYVHNSEQAVLIAAGLKGTNGDIFTEENRGIVPVDSSLQEAAKMLEDKQAEWDEYLATLAPGENPMTGGGSPAFLVDNSQYNKIQFPVIPFIFIVCGVSLLTVLGCKRKRKNRSSH